MSQENVDVVHRWFEEVWNQRQASLIDELLTPESVCYTDTGPLRGPEEFKTRQYQPFLDAFPDLHVEVEAVLAQGDQVVVRWKASGHHAGEGLGCAPTHRPTTFEGISWIQVKEGKLGEGWQSSNISEVVRSLASPSS